MGPSPHHPFRSPPCRQVACTREEVPVHGACVFSVFSTTFGFLHIVGAQRPAKLDPSTLNRAGWNPGPDLVGAAEELAAGSLTVSFFPRPRPRVPQGGLSTGSAFPSPSPGTQGGAGTGAAAPVTRPGLCLCAAGGGNASPASASAAGGPERLGGGGPQLCFRGAAAARGPPGTPTAAPPSPDSRGALEGVVTPSSFTLISCVSGQF